MKTYADRHDNKKKKRNRSGMLDRFREEIGMLDSDELQMMVNAPIDHLNEIFNEYEMANADPVQESHLICEDELAEAEDKVGKSDFIDLLEQSVRARLAESFAGTGFSEKDCPWLAHLFRHYRHRSAKYLEHSIHKYLPKTKNAESVEEYIAPLEQKVERAIAAWLKNGQITEVPDEIPRSLMRVAGQDAANQRARMGKGKELDSSTKSQMEGAMGTDLSDVKVHAGSEGSAFAKELDAQAVTIGKDIAFASDKYKPGTIEGDALIAHELAHVAQQSEAAEIGGMGNSSDYSAMEDDAEGAAMGIMGKLLGGIKGKWSNLKANAWPRLKSGLQVQRCANEPKDAPVSDSGAATDSGKVDSGKTVNPPVKDDFQIWQEEQLKDVATVKSMGAEQWKSGVMRSKWKDVSGAYVDRQKFVGDRATNIDQKITNIENAIKDKEGKKKKKSANIAKLDGEIKKLEDQLSLIQKEKKDNKWGAAQSRWSAFMSKTEGDPYSIEKPDDVSALVKAEKEDIQYLIDNDVNDTFWVKTSMIKFINFLYYGYYYGSESEFLGNELLPVTPNFPSGKIKKGDLVMSYLRSREILNEEMKAKTGQFYRFDEIFVQADVKTLLDKINALYSVNVTPADIKAQLAQESGDFENIAVAGTTDKTTGITTQQSNSLVVGVGQMMAAAKTEALDWIAANTSVSVDETNGTDARTIPKEAVKLTIGYDAHMIDEISQIINSGDGVTVSPTDLKKIGFAFYNGASVKDEVKKYVKAHPKEAITFDAIKDSIPDQSANYVNRIFTERRD